jgi:exodeoxyribonuclease VII large subunit
MEHHSLHELCRIIGDCLSNELEPSYWVVAEIGELRLHQKGHCYLEMVEKDGDQIRAKIRGTIWSYTYRELSTAFTAATGEHLRPGIRILFNCTVQFHEVYGLSLNIRHIDTRFTIGERAQRRQEIVDRLKEEGALDLNKGILLPLVPQRIAVISSPTAAGYGDFMHHLGANSSGYRFHAELFAAAMQGEEAEVSILRALREVLNSGQRFDLLAIIRGGGATLDLDCFDQYSLASVVARFPIPVITGIGHERDETVLDMVAHSRFKTPTAAAEFIISGVRAFEETLDLLLAGLSDQTTDRLRDEGHSLHLTALKLHRTFTVVQARKERLLENLAWRANTASRSSLTDARQHLRDLAGRISVKTPARLQQAETRLNQLEQRLSLLDPAGILRRGYTLSLIDGVPLARHPGVKPGDRLTTIGSGQRIDSEIVSVKPR